MLGLNAGVTTSYLSYILGQGLLMKGLLTDTELLGPPAVLSHPQPVLQPHIPHLTFSRMLRILTQLSWSHRRLIRNRAVLLAPGTFFSVLPSRDVLTPEFCA